MPEGMVVDEEADIAALAPTYARLAGAFPTTYLGSLTPDRIASFGDSSYAEGRLGFDGR